MYQTLSFPQDMNNEFTTQPSSPQSVGQQQPSGPGILGVLLCKSTVGRLPGTVCAQGGEGWQGWLIQQCMGLPGN